MHYFLSLLIILGACNTCCADDLPKTCEGCRILDVNENFKKVVQQTLEEAEENTLDVSLKLLKDCEEVIPTLATWIYEDWSCYDQSLTQGKMIESFQRKLNDDQFPLTLVASREGKPVGLISLKDHETEELAAFENGCLWGGSLHVIPEERGQGIGEFLANNGAAIAKRLGYREIRFYLSEFQGVDWCTHRGAKILQILPFRGHMVTVLSFELTDNPL